MSLVRLLSLAGLLCHCIVVGLSLQDSPTSPANNLPYASKYFQDAQSYFLEFENEAASKGQDGSSPVEFTAVLDHRYAEASVSINEHISSLRMLLAAYFSTMDDLGVETWLAHNSLLGWRKTGKLLLSTGKLDAHLSAQSLGFLVNYYNMSVHKSEHQRHYLIDIHPSHRDANRWEKDNDLVDARWVDMQNGVFLDMSAVWKQTGEDSQTTLRCKDGSQYNISDIYPLRSSLLENSPILLPNNPDKILTHEYGNHFLNSTPSS